jgi:hypothetical protein
MLTQHGRLADIGLAERLVQHLLLPSTECCFNLEGVQQSCSLVVKSQTSQLVAQVIGLETSKPQISGARLIQPEGWDRLNWTVVAPDM